MLGALFGTPENFKWIDYSAAWIINPFGILIPYPKASLKYVAAVAEPLQYEVCMHQFLNFNLNDPILKYHFSVVLVVYFCIIGSCNVHCLLVCAIQNQTTV